MASITSSGIGSGLDVNGIVSQLIAAEARPATLRFDKQEAALQAKLAAFGTVKGALSAFQSALTTLGAASTYQARSAKSSSDAVLTATAMASAAPGNYSITVSSLAKAHSLSSVAFTATSDTVGTGTLTFKFGTTVYDSGTDIYTSFTQNAAKATQTVTIDSTNNTLAGVRDAINKANIGVNAAIVYDGSGYKLTLASSDTGAKNSIDVTVSDNDGNNTDTSGLSRLAFNAGATNLNQTLAASDAALTMNGLAITSASNNIADTIGGVTVKLVAAGTATLTVTRDTSSVSAAVDSFTASYNKLVDVLNSVSAYDATTKKGGPLTGDSTVRTVLSQIRRILGGAVSGLSGSYALLSGIGITSNSTTGKLSVDSAKLGAALDNGFDQIASLFGAVGAPTDALAKFVSAGSATEPGSYAINTTQAATRGAYTGGAVSGFPLTVGATNDTLALKVDGVTTSTLALTQGSYSTGSALAAELQSRINGDSALKASSVTVTVTYVTDHFVVTSDRYGSASTVEVTSVDTTTAATLGFSAASGTAGVDVAGTIGGIAATGSGLILTGSGAVSKLKIEVSGVTTGDRGQIVFTRGYADQLNTLVSNILDADGAIQNATGTLGKQVTAIGTERLKLDKRLEDLGQHYRAQFGALDGLLGRLRATSDYLTQQLATLPGSQARR